MVRAFQVVPVSRPIAMNPADMLPRLNRPPGQIARQLESGVALGVLPAATTARWPERTEDCGSTGMKPHAGDDRVPCQRNIIPC